MPFIRSRNAAMLIKIEPTEAVFTAPSNTMDGVLVENPKIGFNPQNVNTNEVAASLDGRGPIIGGTQCDISFDVYLKGMGIPGTPPELSESLRICGWGETATQTPKTGTTFAVTGTNTITDSANGLATLTVGTLLYLSSPANPYAELLVTASAAGSLTVTKLDGSAPGLTNEAAGGTWTMEYGLAGTAATAGTNTSLTMQAPWAATAQAYRGMPVALSTNPAAGAYAFISDYTVGRVATLTDLFGTALSATTKASLMANVLYQPISNAIPSASIMFYMDGKVWSFKGCRGDVDFTFDAAGACKASFRLMGMFQAVADAAVPSVTYDATRPGTFRNSVMLVDRLVTALGAITLKTGNQLVWPDDPNASEGFGAPQIVSRSMSGQMDPYTQLEATRSLMTDFRAGNQKIVHGRVLGSNAAKHGNRVAVTVPLAVYTDYGLDPADGLSKEPVGFFPYGPDAGFSICFW